MSNFGSEFGKMLTYLLSIVLLLQSSLGFQSLRHATFITQKKDLRLAYDFVIIGGGTSGLTVADRLTEHPESWSSLINSPTL